MGRLEVDVEKQQDIAIVKPKGSLDTITSGEFEGILDGLLGEDCFKFVIDLADVEYISSAGWSVLVLEMRRARTNNGDLKLIHMQPTVSEVFGFLEFASVFKTYDDPQAAIGDF